jgi:hypothetical protein
MGSGIVKTIYAIFNPAVGLYERVEGVDERNKKFIQVMHDFYLQHGHAQPFSIIEVNEDGAETWRTPQGEETLDLNILIEEQRALLEALLTNSEE